jgi:hypothetical protein
VLGHEKNHLNSRIMNNKMIKRKVRKVKKMMFVMKIYVCVYVFKVATCRAYFVLIIFDRK